MADNDEVPLPLGDLSDIPDQSFDFSTFISYEDTLDFGGVPQCNAVSTPSEDTLDLSYDFSSLFNEDSNLEVREGTNVGGQPSQDTSTCDNQTNPNGIPGVEVVGESVLTGMAGYSDILTPSENNFDLSYDFSVLFNEEDNLDFGRMQENIDNVGSLPDELFHTEVPREVTDVGGQPAPVNEEVPVQDTSTSDHQTNPNGAPGVEVVGESVLTGMAGHNEIPTPLEDSPDPSSDFVGGQPSQLGANHMNGNEEAEESLPTGELMSLQQSKRFPGKLYQFVESTDNTMMWNQEGDGVIFHTSRFSRDEHVEFGDCYKGKFKGFWTKLRNYGFNRTLSPDEWLITNKFFLRGKTYLLQCIKRGGSGAVSSSFSNTMDNTSVDPAMQSKMVEMLMDRQRVLDIMAMLNDAVTSYSCKVDAVLEHAQGR